MMLMPFLMATDGPGALFHRECDAPRVYTSRLFHGVSNCTVRAPTSVCDSPSAKNVREFKRSVRDRRGLILG